MTNHPISDHPQPGVPTSAPLRGLSPHHAKLIQASAISDEVANQRGYYTEHDKANLVPLGFTAAQRRVPALVVPVWSADGHLRLHQLRPDDPRRDGKSGKIIKYETPTKRRLIVDVPPPARCWIDDPKRPLFVTEGVRKADSAVSRGLCCVALLGVWNWRGTNGKSGKTALPDWESFALEGREVYVTFDSDVVTKESVHNALDRFKEFLTHRGARVRVVYLPDGPAGAKVGLDDYFASGATVDDLLQHARDRLRPCEGSKIAIQLSTHILGMANKAEEALARSKHEVYQRGGVLTRVRSGAADGPDLIEALPLPSLMELLSDAAIWLKQGKAEEDPKPALPPTSVVQALHARGSWPRLPWLRAVVDHPTLRPDGTVVSSPGHDAASGVLYRPRVDYPSVPDKPTLDDALKALRQIEEPLSDFPFAEPCDRIAAVSLLLTLLARLVIDGPTPVFLVRSRAPGSGKSLLVDALAVIATGAVAPRTFAADRQERGEERKRLLALGLEGARVVLFDNLEHSLGSDVLAAAATARTLHERVLQTSTMALVEVPVIVATGNNATVAGDLGRRVVPIDLDAQVERPEERTGFRQQDLVGWVKRERPRLVVAALAILRWFFVAGRPAVAASPFGSYEAWDTVVRRSLLALTGVDPLAGRARIREQADPEVDALQFALDQLMEATRGEPFHAADVEKLQGRSPEAWVAVRTLGELRHIQSLTRGAIGGLLAQFEGRPLGGLRLARLSRTKAGNRWRVERVQPVQTARNSCTQGCTPQLVSDPSYTPAGADGVDHSYVCAVSAPTQLSSGREGGGGRTPAPATPATPDPDHLPRERFSL